MENVWSIRENKDLYYVLPETAIGMSGIDSTDVAVVAYIYYEDTVEQYLKYFRNIPYEMALYLITSNENTLKKLKEFAQGGKNVQIIQKDNRGRDISALVISSKEIFQKYKYVCFVHDKKAKSVSDHDRVQLWIENLWDNTLKSEGYIKNVLKLFVDNPEIGLLVPPEPYVYMQPAGFWNIEYERTKALAEELKLTNTRIDKEYSPITIGTVFWCRTHIMRKLFDKKWKFEDFVEEPMPAEGTISHAVERILAYLAQDAGSNTATIMTVSYAKKIFRLLQHEKEMVYEVVNYGSTINILNYLWEFYARKKQIKAYVLKHKPVYLFGAGEVGKCYLEALRRMIGCNPEAFLVTDCKGNKRSVNDIPVCSLEEIQISRSTGIIISVGQKIQEEIKSYLQSKSYNEYLCMKDLLEDTKVAEMNKMQSVVLGKVEDE